MLMLLLTLYCDTHLKTLPLFHQLLLLFQQILGVCSFKSILQMYTLTFGNVTIFSASVTGYLTNVTTFQQI